MNNNLPALSLQRHNSTMLCESTPNFEVKKDDEVAAVDKVKEEKKDNTLFFVDPLANKNFTNDVKFDKKHRFTRYQARVDMDFDIENLFENHKFIDANELKTSEIYKNLEDKEKIYKQVLKLEIEKTLQKYVWDSDLKVNTVISDIKWWCDEFLRLCKNIEETSISPNHKIERKEKLINEILNK